MNKIPLHKLHEQSSSGILLKYVDDLIPPANKDDLLSVVTDAHRDDYYLFFLLERGEAQIVIDFKEYHLQSVALGCIIPGQVHEGASLYNLSGWIMCLDAMFVKDEWKEIFETVLISGNTVVPDAETVHDLKLAVALLYKKIQSASQPSTRHIVYSLATAIVGMIAESYRQYQSAVFNKRLMSITLQFKTLLAAHLKTVKSPTQYASMLHISPSYLNEAVKKTTGFSAIYWVQSVAMYEAKRLLFYTDRSIKEIAFELGYDDHTYFTRLFTKLSGMPPSLFRVNYRK